MASSAPFVEEATARLGVRALVSAGWAAPPEARAPHVRVTGEVDHARVLPRCIAAVHHGGVGTVHACLRAALPSVVVSVCADQPFWGQRLAALELGVTLPAERLDARRLERALRVALRDDVRARAIAASARMGDGGAERAARFVIEHVANATGRGLERANASRRGLERAIAPDAVRRARP